MSNRQNLFRILVNIIRKLSFAFVFAMVCFGSLILQHEVLEVHWILLAAYLDLILVLAMGLIVVCAKNNYSFWHVYKFVQVWAGLGIIPIWLLSMKVVLMQDNPFECVRIPTIYLLSGWLFLLVVNKFFSHKVAQVKPSMTCGKNS